MKRVFTEIKGDEKLQNLIEESGCDVEMTNRVIAFLAIYKRLDISTLVAMLYKPNRGKTLEEVCEEVENIAKHEFMRYEMENNQFVVRFELDAQTQNEIGCFQYPLPLVIKPKLVKHNMDSAYYLRNKQSILLNKKTSNKDVDLEHINLMNQVAFSINETVLAKAINKWKPDGKQTQSQIDRFNKYCGVAMKLMLENGNRFRFSHRYDYRGRTYCEGYYLNYQGNDYCKSILEFADKETII